MLLRQKINPETNKTYRFSISNSQFLCSPLLELKSLEPGLKNDPEVIDDIDAIYLSPEAHKLALNGDNIRMKEVMNR